MRYHALQKMASKLLPKMMANPAMAVELAPLIVVVAGGVLLYEALNE